jgi:hypothetical protein
MLYIVQDRLCSLFMFFKSDVLLSSNCFDEVGIVYTFLDTIHISDIEVYRQVTSTALMAIVVTKYDLTKYDLAHLRHISVSQMCQVIFSGLVTMRLSVSSNRHS